MPKNNEQNQIVVVEDNAITAINHVAQPIVVHQTELDRKLAQIDPNRITPAMQAILNARNAQRNPNMSQAQIHEAEDMAMAETMIEVQRQQRG